MKEPRDLQLTIGGPCRNNIFAKQQDHDQALLTLTSKIYR